MKRTIFITLFLFCSFIVLAQELQFIREETVFTDSGENPLLLLNGNQWTNLGLTDFSELKRLAHFDESQFQYQMRFSILIQEAINIERSAIQIRFNQDGAESLYHIPLDGTPRSGATRISNWYITPEDFLSTPWRGLVSVRLLSPPGQNIEVKCLNVKMEIWGEDEEISSYNDNPVLAHAGSFVTRPGLNSRETPSELNLSRSEALDFSLEFIDSLIRGDMAKFYSSLPDQLYSLNSGNSYSRYRINPPEGWGNYSIQDYLIDYSPQIFSYSEYIEIFPQWAQEDRDWNPHEYTYLFMGNQSRNGNNQRAEEPLVFMVGRMDGEVKVLARPEF